MKRIIFVIFILSITTVISAQNYNGGDLKHCLSSYRDCFTSLISRIDSLRNYFADLETKLQSNPEANKISKRICHNYYKSKELGVLIKQLQDLENLLKVTSSQVTPITEKRGSQEQPPVQPVEGQREPRETQKVVNPVPAPVNKGESIEQYLLRFSLIDLGKEGQSELQKKGSDIKRKLYNNRNQELYNAYATILELLNVQYVIYSRNDVKDVLQRASAIKKDLLVGNHYNELQSEIAHVKEYRYATMELQRLIKIVANPSDAIKKELGYDNSGAGDSKWADSEETEIPSSEIRDYLINKNETEYIKKFDYTRRKFDEFVEHPELRSGISKEINDALK